VGQQAYVVRIFDPRPISPVDNWTFEIWKFLCHSSLWSKFMCLILIIIIMMKIKNLTLASSGENSVIMFSASSESTFFSTIGFTVNWHSPSSDWLCDKVSICSSMNIRLTGSISSLLKSSFWDSEAFSILYKKTTKGE